MSVIVAVEDPGGSYLAWDSFWGSETWQPIEDKVVHRTPRFAIGGVGGGRALDLALWETDPPPARTGPDGALSWARCVFVPALKAICKSDETELDDGSALLLAVGGAAVVVYGDFSANRTTDGYTAIGAGSDLALGALAVTHRWKAKRRAEHAVWAACRHSAVVSAPVYSTRVEGP